MVVVDVVHLAHRRQPHADAIKPPDLHQGLRDLEQQSRAVLDRAAMGVGAPVGAGLDELIEQIAVGGVDLDAIEIGGLGVTGRAFILRHDVGHLFDVERARPYERNKFAFAASFSMKALPSDIMAEGATGSILSGCRAGCEMRPTCQS